MVRLDVPDDETREILRRDEQKQPPVKMLSIHLEDEQVIMFNERLSSHDERIADTVGGIPMIAFNPHTAELFYFRILLYRVPGPTCFKDLRRVGDVVMDTYLAACIAHGIVDNDQEVDSVREEAANVTFGSALREVFANMLISLFEASRVRACSRLPRVSCSLDTDRFTPFSPLVHHHHLTHFRIARLSPCVTISCCLCSESDPGLDYLLLLCIHRDSLPVLSVSWMDQQQESITNTGRTVQALVTQVFELAQQIQQLSIPAAPPTLPVPPAVPEMSRRPEPRLPVPESYVGETNFCRAFLTRCSMHFSLQPRTFETEESKVAFVLTLLTGRAALWGTAVWENQDQCCASFHALAAEMKRVFDRAVAGKEAARRLADLKR
ncbi:unnamed protein product [Leuciscus chuanchicus]